MALRQIKGAGTVAWGTNGVAGGTVPAGSIVPSVKLTPKNTSVIEIEDNDGICAFEVLLRDGFNGKFPTLYDNTKTYPVEGANCTLALNWNGANANAIPFGEPAAANGGTATVANGVVTYTCLVVALSPAYEKKKEMYVDWDVTYRPNVAV